MGFRSQKRQLVEEIKHPTRGFGQGQPGLCHVLLPSTRTACAATLEPHLQQLLFDGAKASLELLLPAGTWEKLAPEVLRAVLLTN